jgi:hypothetical protein
MNDAGCLTQPTETTMSEPQTDLERTTELFQYLGDSIDALERLMKAA